MTTNDTRTARERAEQLAAEKYPDTFAASVAAGAYRRDAFTVGFLARDGEAQQERRAFTSELGFGDDVTEPAAKLSELLDPLQEALHQAGEHVECPIICDLCGERLADTHCEHCQGSGVDNALSQATMAYAECEWCAGAQKVHPGCVETSYADLAAQVEAARQWAKKHAARARGESLVRAIEEATT